MTRRAMLPMSPEQAVREFVRIAELIIMRHAALDGGDEDAERLILIAVLGGGFTLYRGRRALAEGADLGLGDAARDVVRTAVCALDIGQQEMRALRQRSVRPRACLSRRPRR